MFSTRVPMVHSRCADVPSCSPRCAPAPPLHVPLPHSSPFHSSSSKVVRTPMQVHAVFSSDKLHKKLRKVLKSHRKQIERLAGERSGSMVLDHLLSDLHSLESVSGTSSPQGTCQGSMGLHSHELRRGGGESSSEPLDELNANLWQRRSETGNTKPSLQSVAAVMGRAEPSSDVILVCQGSKCCKAGSVQVLRTVAGLVGDASGIDVLPTKCQGKCRQAPAMTVRSDDDVSIHVSVSPDAVTQILQGHSRLKTKLDLASFTPQWQDSLQ